MAQTSDQSPDATPSEPEIDTLFVSPVRAGLVSVILLALGAAMAALPIYLVVSSPTLDFSIPALVVGVFFLGLGLIMIWPGLTFLRCIATAHPLIRTDGTTIWKTRMGISMNEISWKNVGSVSIRGLWVILLDGRIKQSKFNQIMFGAKGIWIPALLMHGGGAETMRFIERHKPELIEPLIQRVVSGRK